MYMYVTGYIYTYIGIHIYINRERGRFVHVVQVWGLPTGLEWTLAPDRGVGVTKLDSRLYAWPSRVCVGLGEELETSSCGTAAKVLAASLG